MFATTEKKWFKGAQEELGMCLYISNTLSETKIWVDITLGLAFIAFVQFYGCYLSTLA